jgi:hypothetical protein
MVFKMKCMYVTKFAALEQTCSSMIFILVKSGDLPGALKIYQTLSRFNLWPTIRELMRCANLLHTSFEIRTGSFDQLVAYFAKQGTKSIPT